MTHPSVAELGIEDLARRLSIDGADLLPWLDPHRALPEPPIGQFLKKYLDHLEAAGKSPLSARSYGSALRQIVDGCDVCEPADLGPSAIEAFLQRQQAEGVGASTAENYRGHARRFCQWLTEAGGLPRNPFDRNPAAQQGRPKEARYLDAHGRRVAEGTPGARQIQQRPKKPKRTCCARGWFWLDQYEARGEPTYRDLLAILLAYNALSEPQRKSKDAQHFDKLPADTAEERQRSVSRIYQRIRRAKSIRDRDTGAASLLPRTKGSFQDLCRLFALWHAAEGTPTYHSPAAIRDRWNALPVRIRIAVAGRGAGYHAKLPPGVRGNRIVAQRIRKGGLSATPATPQPSGRGPYFLRLRQEKHWTDEQIAYHWKRELTLDERKAKDPKRYRPVSGPKAVRDAIYQAKRKMGPAAFAGNGEGRLRRQLMEKVAADPRGTLARIRARTCYPRDQYFLQLYEAANTPTYHCPSAIVVHWNALTDQQRAEECRRFVGSRELEPIACFPARPGVRGRSKLRPTDPIPAGPKRKALAARLVARAVWQAKLDREAERKALQVPASGQSAPDGPAAGIPTAQPTAPKAHDREPVAKSEHVAIFGQGKEPTIDGMAKRRLTFAQYKVVQALIEAGPKGLNKDELESSVGDARRVLKRLADKDPDWAGVIRFPGKYGQGTGYAVS